MKKQNWFIILLIFALIIGIHVILSSQPAKDLGLDIFINILSKSLVVALGIYLMKINWNTWTTWKKIGFSLLFALIVFNRVDRIIEDWPRLPWVKAEAFATVDALWIGSQTSREQPYSQMDKH